MVNKQKIKVVKHINMNGVLYHKPEKAAKDYTNIQCADWWQGYLAARVTAGFRAAETDITILHERQVRMLRRVLPIFKRMLQ